MQLVCVILAALVHFLAHNIIEGVTGALGAEK